MTDVKGGNAPVLLAQGGTEPNEPGSWDDDFSYGYLAKLYAELRARFRLAFLGDAEALVGDASAPTAFVRHDVDVSLRRALDLAQREVEWGVRSSYHVMVDNPFYDFRGEAHIVKEIRALGHEVGLHYDIVARKKTEAGSDALTADIATACAMLEEVVGAPVRSLSFHLPVKELMRGPLRVAGRVSAYAEDLFRWYLSDSRARWREGEPIASLASPRSHVLQILVHPIWWGEANQRPAVRARDFLVALAAERGASFHALREQLTAHILYEAADAP